MYALLSFSDYYRLNHSVSVAKGYDLNNPTERVWEVTPTLAKTNIQVNDETETYDIACVALITPDNLQYVTGLTLVQSYEPAPDTFDELILTGMTSEQEDWILKHIDKYTPSINTLWLEDEPPTEIGIIESLVGKGLTVIIPDNEEN